MTRAISIASPSSVHGPTRMRSRPQPKRLRDFRLVLLGVEHSEALAARRESNLCIGREEDVDPSLQGRCNLDGVRLVEMMLEEEIPSTSNQFHAEGDHDEDVQPREPSRFSQQRPTRFGETAGGQTTLSDPEGSDVAESVAVVSRPPCPFYERGLQFVDHEGISGEIFDFPAERPHRPVLRDRPATQALQDPLIEIDADLRGHMPIEVK